MLSYASFFIVLQVSISVSFFVHVITFK